jgi:hypothetical protein
MSQRFASFALKSSLAALAFAAVSPAAAQNKIKLSTVQSIGSVVTYIAQDKGYFKAEGLDVDIVLVNSAAQAVALLAQGEIVPGRGPTQIRKPSPASTPSPTKRSSGSISSASRRSSCSRSANASSRSAQIQ